MSRFPDKLPEVFLSNAKISSGVSQALKEGKILKIASRLYTKNLKDEPEQIVARNWHHVLKAYFPDALIADRTALENKPAVDGSVFIISSKKRSIQLPGIFFKPRKGYGPLESDRTFIHDLRISSEPRAYLENIKPSRARKGTVPRTLSQKELEEKLDKLLQLRGDDHVNQIRDKARLIAPRLGMEKEFRKLDELIGALQGTRNARLVTGLAKARKNKEPYDSDRIETFLKLFEALQTIAPVARNSSGLSQNARINLSFFEAYFSNFIEGTEFKVDEAADIVLKGMIPAERPEDAHDVMGTYRLVSNYHEMANIPQGFDDFIMKLKYRHAECLAMRKEKMPGEFKTTVNVAGVTQFVHPDLVTGTLKRGFEMLGGLEYPFHRAVFMMFLVSEVHPFTDGNGRLARIMMNAELVAAGEQKIIIPVIYRNNYLASLKAMTHNQTAAALIRTLDFAQKYTQSIDWGDFNTARSQLETTNAFMDPSAADHEGIRLKLPES
ncbi:MAG: Fic family protein [Balneolales bacterium]